MEISHKLAALTKTSLRGDEIASNAARESFSGSASHHSIA
jgi:hypothetical protein